MVVPINVSSFGKNVYFVGKDVNTNSIVLKSFYYNDYFYIADKSSVYIKESYTKKIYTDNKKNVYKEYDNTYEADLPLYRRWIIDTYKKFNEMQLPKVNYTYSFLDIEVYFKERLDVESAEGIIVAISVYLSTTNKIYTFYIHKDKVDMENCFYFTSEKEMLLTFFDFIKKNKVDIYSGWNAYKNKNGNGFDFRYLYYRTKKLFGEKKCYDLFCSFSYFDFCYYTEDFSYFKIYGNTIIDYLNIYQKFQQSVLQSYKLSFIANKEVGETKIEYEGDIRDFYKRDIFNFILYNRKDVELLVKIENKLNLFGILDEIRRIAILNFDDCINYSVVHDNIILRLMHKAGYVLRTKEKSNGEEEDSGYVGAYVYLSKPDIYESICDLDFTSLYPFIIRRLNISFDTKLNKYEEGCIKTLNDKLFFTKKHRGVIPAILDWEFIQRKNFKDKMKEALKNKDDKTYTEYYIKQYAIKILMNSLYGFLGFKSSRLYDVDLAEIITITSQFLIRNAINYIKSLGYYVIASDTDSILFKIDDYLKIKEIQNSVNNFIDKITKYRFNIDDSDFDLNKKFLENDYKFNLKNEMFADKGIFFAKRRYILHIVEKEEIKVDEIVYKGVNLIKSDTPEIFKDYAEEFVKNVFSGNYQKAKDMYYNISNYLKSCDIDKIAIKKNLSKKFEEYKSFPAHVRGAIYFNNIAKDFGFETDFNKEIRGKMYYLVNVPQKYKKYFNDNYSYVITIPESFKLPLEFYEYIDYNKHTELLQSMLKSFIDILEGNSVELVKTSLRNSIGKIKNDDIRKEYREKYKFCITEEDYFNLKNEIEEKFNIDIEIYDI